MAMLQSHLGLSYYSRALGGWVCGHLVQNPHGLRRVSVWSVDGNPEWVLEPQQGERVAAQESSGSDGRLVTQREERSAWSIT